MMIALSFWALTLLCCGFAAVGGGRDGRRVAAIYILGCLATVGAWFVQSDWSHTHYATFLVDAFLLVAFWWIAMRSERWFPTWVTGFHLVTVVSHFASFVVPGYAFKLYFFLQGFWSVPMLIVLVVGVVLDRRGGVADAPRTGR
jgi:hypothetical protein